MLEISVGFLALVLVYIGITAILILNLCTVYHLHVYCKFACVTVYTCGNDHLSEQHVWLSGVGGIAPVPVLDEPGVVVLYKLIKTQ